MNFLPLLALLACPARDTVDRGEEGDSAPLCDTATVLYLDSDGDGYGEEALAEYGCAAVGVVPAGDCAPADASVHPYAGDTCGDGVDQDCSGADRTCGSYSPEDASVVLETSGSPKHAVVPAAEPGREVSVILPVQPIGSPASIVSVLVHAGKYSVADETLASWSYTVNPERGSFWRDWDVRSSPGGPQLFAAYDNSGYAASGVSGVRRFDSPWQGVRMEDEASAIWEAEAVAWVELGPAGADGTDRVLVSTGDDAPTSDTYFVAVEADFGVLSSVATTVVEGGHLRPAGDLDGDGIDDMLAMISSGSQIAMVPGPIPGGRFDLGGLVAHQWEGSGGVAVPVGDANGDGLADLAVSGAIYPDEGAPENLTYVFAGNTPSGPVDAAPWLTIRDVCGDFYRNETGIFCFLRLLPAAVGDLDGDGATEVLLMGAYPRAEDPDSGAAVLRAAGRSGVLDLGIDSDPAVTWFTPGAGGAWASSDVDPSPDPCGAFSADYDGDGALDVFLVGYPGVGDASYLYGFRGPID